MGRRVLIVGNFASSWGGTAPVCENLASHLESRGWRVLTASHKEPRLQRAADMVSTAWRGRHDYDVAVVEVYSGPAFLWAEAVSRQLRLLRKPYVLWLHGGNLPAFAARRRRRVGNLFAGSAAVVAQSGYLASILPSRRDSVRMIPNPLDLRLYPYRARTDPRPSLVWLRSFHRVYNPSLAVDVTARVRERFPEVVLTMIGPDKNDGSLEAARALAASLGVTEEVVFHGAIPKPDVPLWLDSADIFLNTSDVDNTPVSVQEAMACGLCVVSTDVGGMPYLAQRETEALLVAPGDADAMATAVCRVLSEAGLGERLSRGARHRVEGMDWSRAVEQWESLLDEVSPDGRATGKASSRCLEAEGAIRS